jgi:ABC-type multidrug transport system fused ATPase/permease subunit
MSTVKTEESAWNLARRFFPFGATRRWLAYTTAALMLLNPLVGGALLWVLKTLVDEVLIDGRLDRLPGFITFYVILISCKLALDYMIEVLAASVAEQVVRDIRATLYGHILSLSPGSLAKYTDGALLTHLSGDVERTEHLVYTGPLAIFSDAVNAVFFLGFLFLLSWKLTVCASLVVPFLVIVSLLLAPRIRRAARIGRWKTTAWMSLAEDRLGSLPVIWAFGAHARETDAFGQRCTVTRKAELRTVAIQASLTVMIEGIAAVGGLLVLVIGSHEISNGALTVGTLVAFLGSIGSMYGPVTGLAKAAGRFQRAAAAAQRVADVLDTPSRVVERPMAKELKNAKGAVEFREVEFAYPSGPKVLDRISLRVEVGEMLAIVGPSGSGKSTLLSLMLRFYDPSAGAILIDGMDIQDMQLQSLMRCVAPVFQEPYIVSGSIGDNIRYGQPDAPQQRVSTVAEAAHADSFIKSLPRGYAAPAGPRGSRLSGGQRQRIALARALLCEAPILLLDEATASVDSETEELIQEAIERYSARRTILLVTHRLSSVRRADRVVVLEKGRIVETGSPNELLASESRCRELFGAQFDYTTVAA